MIKALLNSSDSLKDRIVRPNKSVHFLGPQKVTTLVWYPTIVTESSCV